LGKNIHLIIEDVANMRFSFCMHSIMQ